MNIYYCAKRLAEPTQYSETLLIWSLLLSASQLSEWKPNSSPVPNSNLLPRKKKKTDTETWT